MLVSEGRTTAGAVVTSDPAAAKDHAGVCGPTTAGVCAKVRVLYCKQRSHRVPGLELQPETLVMSGSRVVARTILT